MLLLLLLLMFNVLKVLAVDRRDDKLLVCGSVKQGSCTKFHLSDISSAPEAVVEAVAANTEVSPAHHIDYLPTK